jgi:hypothetical protein
MVGAWAFHCFDYDFIRAPSKLFAAFQTFGGGSASNLVQSQRAAQCRTSNAALPKRKSTDGIQTAKTPCRALGESNGSHAAAIVLVAWFGLSACSSDQSVPSGTAQIDASIKDRESTQAITHATLLNPVDGATEYHDTTIIIHGARI